MTKDFRFSTDFIFEKNQNSHCANSGEKGGCGQTGLFSRPKIRGSVKHLVTNFALTHLIRELSVKMLFCKKKNNTSKFSNSQLPV